ncbi:MAG TPA: glutathione S-transferase family protein [Azospirillum sp.]|nr:glutathione S-transferase family protein [Azospirillum sp.]
MSRIIVHGPALSSYVWSVRIALTEKGLAYEMPAFAFGAQRQPEHLARHPFAKVPAFEHDGFVLYETQAIVRYIDEAFPGPSLQPADVRRRARMNQVIGIMDAYGWPSIAGGILFNRLIAPKMGMPCDEAAVQEAIPRAQQCIAEWERLLGDQPYMAGGAFSLADVMLAPIMLYTPFAEESRALLAEAPRLTAWIGRMRAHSSVAATAPPPMPA